MVLQALPLGMDGAPGATAWVMQVSFDPLLLTLSINPHHSSYRQLKEGRQHQPQTTEPVANDLREANGFVLLIGLILY